MLNLKNIAQVLLIYPMSLTESMKKTLFHLKHKSKPCLTCLNVQHVIMWINLLILREAPWKLTWSNETQISFNLECVETGLQTPENLKITLDKNIKLQEEAYGPNWEFCCSQLGKLQVKLFIVSRHFEC